MGLSLLNFHSPAVAQTASAEIEASSTQADSRAPDNLRDIIVTARRRDERLLTVPIAVTVFDGEELSRRQIRNSDDLGTRVPGLIVQQDSNRNNAFTIRGVARTFNGEAGVITYVAEVPQDVYGSAPLIDLSSIQVLKGPQGTLFGKNSVGGAVLLVPQRPTDEFQGSVGLRLGNYEDREATGVLNVPISPSLKVRLAARYTRRDGLIRNISGPDLNSLNRGTARLSVLFDPSSTFENLLIVDGYKAREGGFFAGILQEVAACPEFFVSCIYDALGKPLSGALTQQRALGKGRVSFPNLPRSKVKVWGATNATTIGLGDITLKNIIGYREVRNNINSDFDGTPLAIVEVTPFPQKDNQFTEELQFKGLAFAEKLDWVVGGFYSHLASDSPNILTYVFGELPPGTLPGFTSLTITDTHVINKSKALFGQATYDLSDVIQGLKITGGLRYTWDTRKFEGASFAGVEDIGACRNRSPDGTFLPGTDPVTCVRTLNAKFKKLTWNANLEYTVSANTFLYLTSRRGYKSGGFNVTAFGEGFATYRPETLTDVEVGAKTQGRTGSVSYRASGAVFSGKYQDIQARRSVVENGGVQSYIVNVGKATIKGFEAEASITPLPGVEIGGFYALTNGKYGQEVDLGPAYAGKRFIGIPKHSAGVNVRVTQEAGKLGTVVFFSNLNYRGGFPTTYDDRTSEYSRVGGVTLIDAAVEVQRVGGNPVDLRLYVQNLANNRSPFLANEQRNNLGVASRIFVDPRTYGVEATWRF
jgi:iron complex outermembrane receptor protein